LSQNPYQHGDFVWCNYPQRENPARPGPRHAGYVVLSTSTDQGGIAVLAYTTSRPWTGASHPLGVYSIDRETAARMGQTRPFTLDLRHIAGVPVTAQWFPELDTPDHGILGRAPVWHRGVYETATKTLTTRHPENIERLSPLIPRPRL
jgi:hypothetical protein